MQRKTKVQLGIIGVCAAALGASTIAVNNASNKNVSDTPYSEISSYSEVASTPDTFEAVSVPANVEDETSDSSLPEDTSSVTVPESTEPQTTPATTTTAAPPETTPATTPAPQTTPATTTTTATTTSIPAATQQIADVVYIAATGKGTKYHKDPNCSKMDGNVIKMTIEEAEAAGYGPCQKSSCYGSHF